MKLAEAINAAYKCEQRLESGMRSTHALFPMTVATAFDTVYLPSLPSESARRTQRSRFNAHLRNGIGRRPLHLIKPSELALSVASVQPSPNCHRPILRLKTSTINRIIDLEKSMFRKFFELDLIDCNIAKILKKLPERNQRVRILHDAELPRFFAVLKEAPIKTRLLISLLILTGMRLGEALSARWDYVDLDSHTMRLPITKSGRPRVVPLSAAACAVCRELQSIRCNAFLFPGRGAGPMSRPSRQITALFAAAGVEGLWVHDLRRSFATRIAEVLPTHAVSAILGHSSTAVTERYLVTTDQCLHDAADSVGRQLAPLISGVAESGKLFTPTKIDGVGGGS